MKNAIAIIFYALKVALCALCLMLTWNGIAWEFNLPQFGFWVPFGVCLFFPLMKVILTFEE